MTMHKRCFLGIALAAGQLLGWLAAVGTLQASEPARFGVIESHDPRFDALVAKDAKLEKLGDGIVWSEGPVWMRDGNFLLFSDAPRNSIMKWKEGEGLSLYMRPSGYTGVAQYGFEPGSNGLTTDPEGRLVCCEHGDRRVSRVEKDGGKKTLVDSYQGKRLNSPNDLCFARNGDLYFTDPPYGLPNGGADHRRELDFNGVYRLSKDGTLTLLTKELKAPNGIALSPDEKTLYVAQSNPANAVWNAFDIQADGTLSAGRVLYDATDRVKAGIPGLPDGLKVDAKGNLFATGPGGIYVFAPDGKLLGTIETGEKTGNCAWGNDGSTLYIMADHFICRIKTTTKGAGW